MIHAIRKDSHSQFRVVTLRSQRRYAALESLSPLATGTPLKLGTESAKTSPPRFRYLFRIRGPRRRMNCSEPLR